MMERAPHVAVWPVALGRPTLRVAARAVMPGDDAALLPQEAAAFVRAIPAVRWRSGAARVIARCLMRELGCPTAPVPRAADGSPVWPEGLVGSLAHDDALAVAALAHATDWRALGVDVEPAVPLPFEIVARVASQGERARYDVAGLDGRRLVVAKEAAFKAAFALDGAFLDWLDIEVDLDAGIARLSTGRAVPIDIAQVGAHLIALASIAR